MNILPLDAIVYTKNDPQTNYVITKVFMINNPDFQIWYTLDDGTTIQEGSIDMNKLPNDVVFWTLNK